MKMLYRNFYYLVVDIKYTSETNDKISNKKEIFFIEKLVKELSIIHNNLNNIIIQTNDTENKNRLELEEKFIF